MIVKNSRSAVSGFTLIEILIVVAVVAILSAIAIPSYSDYVRRANLVDGQKAMASIAADLEQVFADKRAYPATLPATATGTALMPVTYKLSTDAQSYVLLSSGVDKMTTYHLVQTTANARCKCEKCAVSPFGGMVGTVSACPSGAKPW